MKAPSTQSYFFGNRALNFVLQNLSTYEIAHPCPKYHPWCCWCWYWLWWWGFLCCTIWFQSADKRSIFPAPPRSVDFWLCPTSWEKNSPSIPGFNRQLIGNGYLPLDTCSTKFEKVPSTNRNIMMAMMDQIEILDERATKPRSDCVQSPKLGLPTWWEGWTHSQFVQFLFTIFTIKIFIGTEMWWKAPYINREGGDDIPSSF